VRENCTPGSALRQNPALCSAGLGRGMAALRVRREHDHSQPPTPGFEAVAFAVVTSTDLIISTPRESHLRFTTMRRYRFTICERRASAGRQAAPFKAPADEAATVISGSFNLGMGDKFDTSPTMNFSPGALPTPLCGPAPARRLTTLLANQDGRLRGAKVKNVPVCFEFDFDEANPLHRFILCNPS
jgi:hypothetical protein